jgi:radical SAM-linked protein
MVDPTHAEREALRHRYQVVVSIEGRIRFLSHLETVDTLLQAMRRAGFRFALSQGMKPKPVIKVAMPRPVAVEAWSDIVEVELADDVDPDQLALALTGALPDGIALQRVDKLDGAYASAASRVAGATFRITFDNIDFDELDRLAAAFRAADELLVDRNTPKQKRTVDVRAVVGDNIAAVQGEPPAIRFHTRLTATGSAKPEEVSRAIAGLAGRELTVRRTVREAITLAQPGGDGRVAEPALVGADVPDGPERPWGAC